MEIFEDWQSTLVIFLQTGTIEISLRQFLFVINNIGLGFSANICIIRAFFQNSYYFISYSFGVYLNQSSILIAFILETIIHITFEQKAQTKQIL